MNPITLYLHGQGISTTTANIHCRWVRRETGLKMTPLTYQDVAVDQAMTLFGRELMAPLATTSDAQVERYVTDLVRQTEALDEADRPAGPNFELARAYLYESFRSGLRYLLNTRFGEQVRQEILGQLQAMVAGSTKPIRATLVAHSLGSVIALDLLPALPPGITIERLITLGSPLGLIASLPGRLDEVMLAAENRRLDIPWHDFATEGDLLATMQRISRRRGFRAEPLTVTTILGEFTNPHEGYFLDRQVALAWARAALAVEQPVHARSR